MFDAVEVLQHWYSGRSETDVGVSLGVDRGTIRKYVTPAESAGMTPGGTSGHGRNGRCSQRAGFLAARPT